MISVRKENDFQYDLFSICNEEEHIHQDTELIYVLQGTLHICLEEESYQLFDEDMIIINMNKHHSLTTAEASLIFRIRIPYALLNRYVDQDHILFWCNTTLDRSEYYHNLRICLRQMLGCIITNPSTPNPMTVSYFYELLHYLCDQFLVKSGDKHFEQNQSKYDKRMNDVVSYIEENYNQSISLNDLADQVHLTYSYLSRHFKKMFGTNFLEYMNKVRLHHAVEDLLYTDKPITRIAVDNGFVNSSGLNKIFKDTYEMTPTDYKKMMRAKLLSESSADDNKINQQSLLYERAKSYIAEKGIEQRYPRSIRHYTIQVDASIKKPYVKHWIEMINIGRASDLLKAKVREQTLILRDELGFRYVRFWNLFHTDMEIRTEHQTDLLNFDKIDEVLDFLVYNNLLPFIELVDKPIRIAKNTSEFVKLDEQPPNFHQLLEYKLLLTRFFHHIITRYHDDQVKKWRFECWYDDFLEQQTKDVSFFDIFNTTCEVIRPLLPDAVIGGCGMRINDVEAESILRAWKEQPYQPDFFSVLSYPYEPASLQKENHPPQLFRPYDDDNFLKRQVTRVKKLLREIGMDIPLYVTEWNCTISSRNYINDTCYKGTYIMKNAVDLLGEIDVMGYYSGLDLTAAYYDSQEILNGCPGLLTKDNICKPAYYAFRFLQRMGTYLVKSGENYLITTTGHFSYYIICYNYHSINRRYFQKEENLHSIKETQTLTSSDTPLHMDFHLDHLPADRHFIKTFTIGPHHGSVLDEWVRLNTMSNMRQEDVNYLKRICTPHMSIQEIETEKGTLHFELELEPEEIALIHIYHQY